MRKATAALPARKELGGSVRLDSVQQAKRDRLRYENRMRRETVNRAHPIAAEDAFRPFAELDDLLLPASRQIALKPLIKGA
jgi:hypothetical protein